MALIKVKVHPGSKKERIDRRDRLIEIWVKEEAKNDEANRRVIEILKEIYGRVRLVRGRKSRLKFFEVEG